MMKGESGVKDLHRKINELIRNRKQNRRFIACLLTLSVLVTFVVPVSMIAPGVSMTRQNAGKVDISKIIQLNRRGDSTPFVSSAPSSPMAGSSDFEDKIQSISVISGGKKYDGTPCIVDAGDVDSALLSITLNYEYNGTELAESGILDNHYVHYNIPKDLIISQDYYGSNMTVIDTSWEQGSTTPAGYYAISKGADGGGLISIYFTNEYISYLNTCTNGFKGAINFSGNVSRADDADGDRTVVISQINDVELNVDFADDKLTIAKEGQIKHDGPEKYILWTVTLTDPRGYIDLSQYSLTDVLKDNGTTLDWSTVSDISVTPEGSATHTGNGNFTLSGSNQQVTITYKQSHLTNGHTYDNDVSAQKGDETPITASKTMTIENKLNINKTGTPDYYIDGAGSNDKIQWTIHVDNYSGDGLGNATVEDSAAIPADAKVYYFDEAWQRQELDPSKYTISENTITFKPEPNIPASLDIVYMKDVAFDNTDGIASTEQTNSASVRQDVPNPPTPADTGDVTVKYEHQFQVGKWFDDFNSDTEEVKWKITATANAYTDQNGEPRVDANSKRTLEGYTIKDPAFVGLTADQITFNAFRTFNRWSDASKESGYTDQEEDLTSYVTLSKDQDSDTVTIHITDDTKIVNKIELFYTKPLENTAFETGNYAGYQAGQEVKVSNTAEGTSPDGKMKDGAEGVGTLKMRIEGSKSYRGISDNKTSSVVGMNDTEDRELNWKIKLTKDNYIVGGDKFEDHILNGENGGVHYITPEQAAAIEIYGNTVDNDSTMTKLTSDMYTIKFFDASGTEITDLSSSTEKAVKFEVTFTSEVDASKYKYISVNYKTEADISGVENGNTSQFSNRLTFNGTPKDVPGMTFERKDPNPVETIRLKFIKSWEDKNNAYGTRPANIKIKIWQARAEDGAAPAETDTEKWTMFKEYTLPAGAKNGEDWFELPDDVPKWAVDENGCVVEYYYRIEEILDEESGYTATYNNKLINAMTYNQYESNQYLKVTNKTEVKGYGKSSIRFDYEGVLDSVNSTADLNKKTLDLDGSGTAKEYYIFRWLLNFDMGSDVSKQITYIDTLPEGAIYLDTAKAQSLGSDYAPAISYSDNPDWRRDFPIGYEYYGMNDTYEVDGDTLTLTLRENTVVFRYCIAIPVDKLDEALVNGVLTNKIRKEDDTKDKTATLTIINSSIPDDPINDENNHLKKKFNAGVAGGYLNYSLEVNPEGEKLTNDDYISITDKLTLGEGSSKTMDNLRLALDHIAVYPYNEDGTVDKTHPITDYSYTIDYNYAPRSGLNVSERMRGNKDGNADTGFFMLDGWKVGDYVTITANKNPVVNGNSSPGEVFFYSDFDKDAPNWYANMVTGAYTLPDFNSSGTSVLNFQVPEYAKYIVIVDKSNYGYDDNGVYHSNVNRMLDNIEAFSTPEAIPAVLNVEVPDQQHLYVEYRYSVTGYTPNTAGPGAPSNGDKIYFDNIASFEEDNASGWSKQSHSEMNVSDSSASAEAIKYPSIYKVDVNNYTLNTLSAVFKVAKYDTDSGQWVYASSIEPVLRESKYVRKFTFPDEAVGYTEVQKGTNDKTYPEAAASLVFADSDDAATDDKENVHDFILEQKTLYKFVEVQAPTDYLQPDWSNGGFKANSEYVFYYSYDGFNGTPPEDAFDENGISRIRPLTTYGTANIPNSCRIQLQAKKTFSGKDIDIPDTASVELKLYYSFDKNGTDLKPVTKEFLGLPASDTTFSNPINATYEKNPDDPDAVIDTVEWTGLLTGKNGSPVYYFVQEESYTANGKKYTFDPASGRFKHNDEISPFIPVYTRNGTNKDGTQIGVNNSEGIQVKKRWINLDGKEIPPPKEVGSSTESMAVDFEVYGIKGPYKVKLDLEDHVLNAANEYKLQLPVEVGLVDVPAGSAATYLEYIEGKKYPLAYFDNFEVAEKLTEAQKAALDGKFLEPQTSRMISNGTGVLEIINTDKRQAAVNATVEKIWNDMGADHSGDQIRVKFVQSLYQLTEEQLEAIAEGNIPEGTYTGEDIQSNKDVKVIVKGKTKAFILDSNISSISSASSIATINHNSDQLIITGDTAGTETITVTFSDGTEQELTITVIEPEVLLDETGSWTASWNGLPSADDSGSDYYYYAVEEEVPEGYIASYVNRTSSGTFRTTITNTQPTELKIVKKWYDVLGDEIVTDPDDADYNAAKLNKLPDSITVEIYQLLASQAGGTKLAMPADADINSILIGTPYRICTLEKADGFSKILKDLPKTNDQNEEYVYYFKEVGTHVLNSAEGYYNLSEPEYRYISEVKYQNNGLVATENGIVTISNKLKPAKIKFIKTWADGNENHDGEQVTIRVYRSTTADTEEAQQNPLILSLDKNPVTMTKSDTSGVTVTANQKVKIISAEGEDYDNTLINVATDGVAGRILNITPTGTKTGTTTIKLQSEDGQIVELIVNVTDDPALMLTADKSTFKYDETPAVLTATYTAPGATPEDVTNKSSIGYTSSNTDVIEVAADGTLTVKGVGDATITATYKGLQDSVTLTVELPDTFNVIGEDTVNVGDTLDLDVDPPFGTFEWSSSDETVATVDDNGVVTPVGEGTANITATRNDEEEASKEITVEAPSNIKTGQIPLMKGEDSNPTDTGEYVEYSYDESTNIITLNLPKVNVNAWQKYIFTGIKTNEDLKDLKPIKYEVYPTGTNTKIGLNGANGWLEAEGSFTSNNPAVFTTSGNTSFAQSNSWVGFMVSSDEGPYVMKIQVAGGAEPQPTDYIQTMDSNGGKYRIADYIPAGSQVVFKLKDVTGSGAAWASAKFNVGGNNNNTWTNLNGDTGYVFNLDENGEKTYTITVDRDLTDAELQMWYYNGTASNLQLVSCEVVEAPAPNGAPRRRSAAPGTESGMPLTRFSASTLRLGKAKAYAASAPSEIPETGSADSGQKSMMSTPKRSAGTPTFEDDGYIEKTISSSDDWQLIANDLPMYNVKADGTVEPYYYWVEEVGGADGYKASYLFIDGDEHTEYSVNASTGTTPEITIQNTPDDTGVELPETGGKGMKTIYMAGGVMILLAIAGGLKVRKRIKNV